MPAVVECLTHSEMIPVCLEKNILNREERVSLTVSFLQKKQHKRMGVVKSRSEMFDDRKHEKITLMML